MEPGQIGAGRLKDQVIQPDGWIAAAMRHLACSRLAHGVCPQSSVPSLCPDPARGTHPARVLAAGMVCQLEIGGDPWDDCPRRCPRQSVQPTSCAVLAARPIPTARQVTCCWHRQAGDLLLALAAVECHISVGGSARIPPALLRDVVILAARLAGATWLDANADHAAAFTALQASWQPPPLPELDLIPARVLSDRFGLPEPAAAA